MPVLDQPTVSTEMPSFPLVTSETCDRCGPGTQAFVRAVMPSGNDLVFCKHHANQYAAGLAGAGARLEDESGTINLKPTDPSRSQGF